MSEKPPVRPPALPPTPAVPLTYASPTQPPGGATNPPPAETSVAQRVFDTVAGPNVRLKDNLIQLACVIVGGGAGAGIGAAIAEPEDRQIYMTLGAVGGLIVALLVSGLVIGIVRGVGAMRR